MQIINLEAGYPTADEALRRMEFEMRRARSVGERAVKLIHGYGSSGKGGKIRSEVRRALAAKQRAGEIKGFIAGEDFSPFGESYQRLSGVLPALSSDRDFARGNDGITVVVFK